MLDDFIKIIHVAYKCGHNVSVKFDPIITDENLIISNVKNQICTKCYRAKEEKMQRINNMKIDDYPIYDENYPYYNKLCLESGFPMREVEFYNGETITKSIIVKKDE